MDRKRAGQPQEVTLGNEDAITDGSSVTERNRTGKEGFVEDVETVRVETVRTEGTAPPPGRVIADSTTLRNGRSIGASAVGTVVDTASAAANREPKSSINRSIPSMINDSTDNPPPPTDSMMTDSPASCIIAHVRPGMTVVDADGEELGKVDHVKMGDPGAATVGADAPVDPAFLGTLLAIGAEPAVAEPHRSRLLRFGYVKVDGKGWFDTDRYLWAGMITDVAENTVRRRVRKHENRPDES